MPRSQLPSPAWYHVISRGVEQRTIVLDDRDRESWFKLLVDVTERFGWRVHAWNLLDNHFHLLVETTQPELSRGMQRLNGVHAMRFNRRYARSGHLFQGRFESRVLEGDDHVATVIEYVYENSTSVGLRGWPWRGSGHHPRDYASARHGRPSGGSSAGTAPW
jgi:putative transposase